MCIFQSIHFFIMIHFQVPVFALLEKYMSMLFFSRFIPVIFNAPPRNHHFNRQKKATH